MPFADALRAGMQLHQYIAEAPQKAEQAKLQAQLYKSQSDYHTANAALLQGEVEREKTLQAAFAQERLLGGAQPPKGQAQSPGLQETLTRAPNAPRLTSPLTQQPVQPQGHREPAPGQGMQQYVTQLGQRLQSGVNPQAVEEAEYTPLERQQVRYASILMRLGGKEGRTQATNMLNSVREQQKQRLGQQEQQVYDELGQLEAYRGSLASSGLLTPTEAAKIRSMQAALLNKAKKPADAQKLLAGDTTVLTPGAQLYQSFAGGPPQQTAENPNRPVSVPEGAMLVQPQGGTKPAVPITPTPKSPEQRARERGRGARTGALEADATPLTQAPEGGGYTRFLIQDLVGAPITGTDGQPAFVDVPPGPGALEAIQRQYPGYVFAPVGPAPTSVSADAKKPLGAQAQLAADKEAAVQRKKVIPREAAEQIGVPLGTTYEQLETGTVKPEQAIPRQPSTQPERKELAEYDVAIATATDLLAQMKKDPKVAGLLGNILVDPSKAVARLLARKGADVATPEQRKFLAKLGVSSATLRTVLIGLAQTNREMGGLVDFISGPETSPEQVQASLEAILEHTTLQRDKRLGVMEGSGVQTPIPRTPQGGGKAPAAKEAAPAQETPEQIEERIRKQMKLPARTQ